jgi:hypothetical protein
MRQRSAGDEHDEAEVHHDDGVGEDPAQHEASRGDGTPAGAATRARSLVARAGGALIVAGYGWWAVSLPPFSGMATAAVLAAGTAAVVAGAAGRRRRPRQPPARVAGWGLWVVLAAAAALWQAAAYLQQPRHEHPTLSSLANALLDSHPARAAAFVLWLLATIRLARR